MKRLAEPTFNQNYESGSISSNYQCAVKGSCGISPNRYEEEEEEEGEIEIEYEDRKTTTANSID